MDKIKTAVIGVGNLGRHHARWYKNIDISELVGVYDIDTEKNRIIAENLDVIPFTGIEEVFEHAEAVSIVVPTTFHYQVAETVINNGLNCLIEKPITATTQEAENLMSLAKKKKVVLTVGHIERFNPAVCALDEIKIEPRFIEAHRLAAFDPRGTDVAVILDLMIHDIELALHFVDSNISRIDASAVAVISDKADIANARLTFENGAVANLTASRISLNQMRKLRIFQKSGYYSLDLANKRADIYQLAEGDLKDAPGMKFPLGKSGKQVLYNKAGDTDEDMLQTELRSFLEAIKSGGQPKISLRDAAEALRVAVEIDRIGHEGNSR
jgi:predicted dehydrogenase